MVYALITETTGRPPRWLDVQDIDGKPSISKEGVVVISPARDDLPQVTWLAGWYAVEDLAYEKPEPKPLELQVVAWYNGHPIGWTMGTVMLRLSEDSWLFTVDEAIGPVDRGRPASEIRATPAEWDSLRAMVVRP